MSSDTVKKSKSAMCLWRKSCNLSDVWKSANKINKMLIRIN